MPYVGPDFKYESQWIGYVCGVDEAGRGPCAGPLAVAAVILDQKNIPFGIRDSKKMTEAQRFSLAPEIKSSAIAYHIVMISPEDIDQLNIFQATMLGMKKAVEGLSKKADHALIDGNKRPQLDIPSTTIIKGDSLSLSIAAASILAKTARDEIMIKMDELYPDYGFSRHKGYQSKAHIEALKQYGPCAIHRRSWATVSPFLS